MYQMMLNRKNSKKGFTLVEVIVVLVILAILAALLIPAMTGWIDKANEKSDYIAARTFLLAAQTLASEQYATTPGATSVGAAGIMDLADLDAAYSCGDATVAAGKVTNLVVTGKQITLTWNGTSWAES